MLNLYLGELPDELRDKLVTDVEEQFLQCEITCTERNKKIIQDIDNGTLLSTGEYRDQFQRRLPTTKLSLGCKSVFCVVEFPELVIPLDRCSIKARDYTISTLRNGFIFVGDTRRPFSGFQNNKSIDVNADGHHFSNIDDLNSYVLRKYH